MRIGEQHAALGKKLAKLLLLLVGERQLGRAGDPLEHAPLADGKQLAALALGDVRDAAADQPSARGRQPYEPHLAGHVVILRITVDPLEAGSIACERALDMSA